MKNRVLNQTARPIKDMVCKRLMTDHVKKMPDCFEKTVLTGLTGSLNRFQFLLAYFEFGLVIGCQFTNLALSAAQIVPQSLFSSLKPAFGFSFLVRIVGHFSVSRRLCSSRSARIQNIHLPRRHSRLALKGTIWQNARDLSNGLTRGLAFVSSENRLP